MNMQVHPMMRSVRCERLLVAIAAAAMLAGAGSANAQGTRDRAVVVRTADLDLSSPKGVIELNARIKRAAYQVCDRTSPADTRSWPAVTACAWRVAHRHRREARQLILAAQGGNTRQLVAAGRMPMAG